VSPTSDGRVGPVGEGVEVEHEGPVGVNGHHIRRWPEEARFIHSDK
jgi:hypothetical protein